MCVHLQLFWVAKRSRRGTWPNAYIIKLKRAERELREEAAKIRKTFGDRNADKTRWRRDLSTRGRDRQP